MLVLAVWLALALTLCAAPLTIKGPAQVEPYRLAELTTDAPDGSALIWDIDREDVADVREYPGRLVFTGPPGSYKIKCRLIKVGTDGKVSVETARTTVTIGIPPPPDPPPQPPPDPSDPLSKSLRAAWVQETDPSRAGQVAFLTSVYKAVGAGVLVDDPAVKTNADLLAALRAAVHTPGVGIPDTALPKVRRAVADYLAAELGTSAVAPIDRAKAKAAMAKVAASLETLK